MAKKMTLKELQVEICWLQKDLEELQVKYCYLQRDHAAELVRRQIAEPEARGLTILVNAQTERVSEYREALDIVLGNFQDYVRSSEKREAALQTKNRELHQQLLDERLQVYLQPWALLKRILLVQAGKWTCFYAELFARMWPMGHPIRTGTVRLYNRVRHSWRSGEWKRV